MEYNFLDKIKSFSLRHRGITVFLFTSIIMLIFLFTKLIYLWYGIIEVIYYAN